MSSLALYINILLFISQIYHASEEFGTHDIRTSGGYFHMGNVFFRQGRMDVADTLYRQVSCFCIYTFTLSLPVFVKDFSKLYWKSLKEI